MEVFCPGLAGGVGERWYLDLRGEQRSPCARMLPHKPRKAHVVETRVACPLGCSISGTNTAHFAVGNSGDEIRQLAQCSQLCLCGSEAADRHGVAPAAVSAKHGLGACRHSILGPGGSWRRLPYHVARHPCRKLGTVAFSELFVSWSVSRILRSRMVGALIVALRGDFANARSELASHTRSADDTAELAISDDGRARMQQAATRLVTTAAEVLPRIRARQRARQAN